MFHAVVTRFCIRQSPTSIVSGNYVGVDALEPSNLEYRFSLLETTCASSVFSQTSQNFWWIVVTDPELPPSYLQRLESLLSAKKNAVVHKFESGSYHRIRDVGWLTQYAPPGTKRFLTTRLDSDDLLSSNYVRLLGDRTSSLLELKDPPPLATFGVVLPWEWDILPRRTAPLGTIAPWHRHTSPASAGLSVLCDIRIANVSAVGFSHKDADKWWSSGYLKRNWQLRGTDCSWAMKFAPSHYWHNLTECGAVVIMSNHFMNIQVSRLMERKAESVVATRAFIASLQCKVNHKSFVQCAFGLSWIIFFQLCQRLWRLHRKRPDKLSVLAFISAVFRLAMYGMIGRLL